MPPKDVLQGTLDLLILKALDMGAMHGWGIQERIRQTSAEELRVNQGSLYPALYRLKRRRLIAGGWQVTENNRRARYYELTRAGEAQLAAEREQWERLSRGVNLILGEA